MSDSQMDDIKQSIKLLTELALRSDERMDDLEEAQANSERKIAALADAQIRTEEAQQRTEESLARLSTSMDELTVKMSELAVAQAHSDQRLDALIDIVRERLGGQPQG
jgi:uncharacterized coiled-coil protein SlyX